MEQPQIEKLEYLPPLNAEARALKNRTRPYDGEKVSARCERRHETKDALR